MHSISVGLAGETGGRPGPIGSTIARRGARGCYGPRRARAIETRRCRAGLRAAGWWHLIGGRRYLCYSAALCWADRPRGQHVGDSSCAHDQCGGRDSYPRRREASLALRPSGEWNHWRRNTRLDPLPQIARRNEVRHCRRTLADVLDVPQQTGATHAFSQMLFDRSATRILQRSLEVIGKRGIECFAGHVGARHRCSASLKRSLARCNCALLPPEVIPSISPISSCLYPSTSWSTKTFRAPAGSFDIASARSIRSMCIGARATSSHRSSSTSPRSILEACLPSFFLAFSTTFTASRCSQVENALSPLNCGSFSQVLTNTSWVSSSPLVLLPDIRAQIENTLFACVRYSRSKAWRSPPAASATSVESPIAARITLDAAAIREFSLSCCV